MTAFTPSHLNVSWFSYPISYCWLPMTFFYSFFSLFLPLSPIINGALMNILVPTYLCTFLIGSLGNILEMGLLVQRKCTFDKCFFKAFSVFSFHPNPALKVRNCCSSLSVDVASSKKAFLPPRRGGGILDFSHPSTYHMVLGLPWTVGGTKLLDVRAWVCLFTVLENAVKWMNEEFLIAFIAKWLLHD